MVSWVRMTRHKGERLILGAVAVLTFLGTAFFVPGFQYFLAVQSGTLSEQGGGLSRALSVGCRPGQQKAVEEISSQETAALRQELADYASSVAPYLGSSPGPADQAAIAAAHDRYLAAAKAVESSAESQKKAAVSRSCALE